LKSAEFLREIKLLHEYKSLRTIERVQEIRGERRALIPFGPFDLPDLSFDDPIVGYVAFIQQAAGDPIFRLKKIFDRVRPSYFDPSLEPVIAVPSHPAYPSGHACQYYMVAHALALLAPELTEMMMKKAERIARNREIAGVHYPSDSKAGKILAEQIFAVLKERPTFKEKLARAQERWIADRSLLLKRWESSRRYEADSHE
jgi:hypothetical protein